MSTLKLLADLLIPAFVLFVVLYGAWRRVPVYTTFVAGAKQGIPVVLGIFPYVLAILVAVKGFQASGALAWLQQAGGGALAALGLPVEALQVAVLKPLSGSASLAAFTDLTRTVGPDSQASRTAAVIMGSAETTFYVLAVYLGAVGLKNTRYLVPVCLLADVLGVAIAVGVVRLLA
jgi:spore maturation protein B